MEFWFWVVASGAWVAISLDLARSQTPLLLLDQARSREAPRRGHCVDLVNHWFLGLCSHVAY